MICVLIDTPLYVYNLSVNSVVTSRDPTLDTTQQSQLRTYVRDFDTKIYIKCTSNLFATNQHRSRKGHSQLLLLPIYTTCFSSYASAVSGHTGRNPLRLFVPSIRTSYGRGSLWFRGTTIWNNLSPTVIVAQYLKYY